MIGENPVGFELNELLLNLLIVLGEGENDGDANKGERGEFLEGDSPITLMRDSPGEAGLTLLELLCSNFSKFSN